MKFKLILPIFLVFSLQLFAMEQSNEEQTKEKIIFTNIERDKSLGTLAIFPDEILLNIILETMENSTYKKAAQILKPLKLTSKQLNVLADYALKPRFTDALRIELNNMSWIMKYQIDWKKITELIQFGADVNAKNFKNQATLLCAVLDKRKDVVEILLKNHVDVNAKDTKDCDQAALMKAVYYDYSDIVELLLNNDEVDINAQDNAGFTALILAAAKGHAECVKLLLKKGADRGLKNTYNDTAMDCAKRKGNTYIINLLQKYNVQ